MSWRRRRQAPEFPREPRGALPGIALVSFSPFPLLVRQSSLSVQSSWAQACAYRVFSSQRYSSATGGRRHPRLLLEGALQPRGCVFLRMSTVPSSPFCNDCQFTGSYRNSFKQSRGPFTHFPPLLASRAPASAALPGKLWFRPGVLASSSWPLSSLCWHCHFPTRRHEALVLLRVFCCCFLCFWSSF